MYEISSTHVHKCVLTDYHSCSSSLKLWTWPTNIWQPLHFQHYVDCFIMWALRHGLKKKKKCYSFWHCYLTVNLLTLRILCKPHFWGHYITTSLQTKLLIWISVNDSILLKRQFLTLVNLLCLFLYCVCSSRSRIEETLSFDWMFGAPLYASQPLAGETLSMHMQTLWYILLTDG